METGDKEIQEKENTKIEETYRLTVSKAAERAVIKVVEKVNQEFEAGQVNRSQVASWVLLKFSEDLTSDDLRAIRADHVNEITLFEHYFKKAKETGQIPSEIRDFIRKMAGNNDTQRKPLKKNLQKTVINDDI